MKKFFRFILILAAAATQLSYASGLGYYTPDLSHMTIIGADLQTEPDAEGKPQPTPELRMIRCEGSVDDFRATQNAVAMKQLPQEKCRPVNSSKLTFEQMPEAVLQTFQDWQSVMGNEKLFKKLSEEIAAGIKNNIFQPNSFDPKFLRVNMNIGNTKYGMDFPNFLEMGYPASMISPDFIREFMQKQVKGIFDESLMKVNPFTKAKIFATLGTAFQMATAQVGIRYTDNPGDFYSNVLVFSEFVAWADSQNGKNKECMDLLQQFHTELAGMEMDSSKLNTADPELKAFFEQYLNLPVDSKGNIIVTAPIFRTDGYVQTKGNACFNILMKLQDFLAENAERDHRVISTYAADGKAAAQNSTYDILRERVLKRAAPEAIRGE